MTLPLLAAVGLQLWSLRTQFQHDLPGTLALTQSYGFHEVETAGNYGLPAEEFGRRLRAHGLNPVSAHFTYSLWESHLPEVIAQAKALGVHYVVLPALPHTHGFTVADARAAAANLNRWAAAVAAQGMTFAYHTHGYEFQGGVVGRDTPFDILAKATDPATVFLEMDVFWVAHAGVDPVSLLERYRGRWRLLHLKDFRRGASTDNSGAAPATDILAVGAGTIPWPRVLAAARASGVRYYFLEDESVDPVGNIPISLRYLAPFRL